MTANDSTAKTLQQDYPPGEAPSVKRKPPSLMARHMDPHVVSLVDPDCYEAEQYRKLRYVLEEKRAGSRGLVVAVCSPAAGDGKSLTSINLAAALAQAPDDRVLLIDADLRLESASLRSNLHIGKHEGPGLTDAILHNGTSLKDVARPLAGSNLSVVMTGSHSSAPYEMLRSARFGELLDEARQAYDYVILDVPPVVPVSDCRVIAKWVDGLLMVVAAHRTPRAMLEEALDLMGPEKLLGLVFNGSDLMPRRYYGYYGYSKPTAAKGTRGSAGARDAVMRAKPHAPAPKPQR
jgi:capsular exopolysaccharide synthesis family protein